MLVLTCIVDFHSGECIAATATAQRPSTRTAKQRYNNARVSSVEVWQHEEDKIPKVQQPRTKMPKQSQEDIEDAAEHQPNKIRSGS